MKNSKIYKLCPHSLVCVMPLLLASLFSFLHITVQPFPIEILEGANVLSAIKISQGENPFSGSYPEDANPYGFAWPLLISLVKISSDDLLSARLLTAILIFITTLLFIYFSKNKKLTVLILSYWISGSIFILNFLGAFPNQLGILIFSLTLLLYQNQKSFNVLMLISLLGVLAFYTKGYFIVANLVVLLYHFFWVSKSESLKCAVLSTSIFLVTFLIMEKWFPYYFHSTLFTQMKWSSFDINLLFAQTVKFLYYFSPLIIFAIISIIGMAKSNLSYSFQLFSLILVSLLMLHLGARPGAYDMSYHTQLLVPVLILCIGSNAANLKFKIIQNVLIICIAFLTIFFLINIYNFSSKNFGIWNDQWSTLKSSLKLERCPYVSVPLALEVLGNECADYESGTTGYYAETPYPKGAFNKTQDYYNYLSKKITAGEYSALYISNWGVGVYNPRRRGVEIEDNYQKILFFPTPSFYEEIYGNSQYTGISVWKLKNTTSLHE